MKEQQVFQQRNKLPVRVTKAGRITTFKRPFDRYLERKGAEGSVPKAGKWL